MSQERQNLQQENCYIYALASEGPCLKALLQHFQFLLQHPVELSKASTVLNDTLSCTLISTKVISKLVHPDQEILEALRVRISVNAFAHTDNYRLQKTRIQHKQQYQIIKNHIRVAAEVPGSCYSVFLRFLVASK